MYIKPVVFLTSFTCPHCNTVSNQNWWSKDSYGQNLRILVKKEDIMNQYGLVYVSVAQKILFGLMM